MQCHKGRITITGLSTEFSSARPYKIQGGFSLHRSTPIHAIALFWNQSDGGYISIAFVEKALGSLVPRGHNGIHLIVQITWRLAIFDKGTETSHLRAVSELDHDVVFGRGVGCGNWKDSLASQQPLFNSFNHLNSSWEGWLRIAAVVEQLIRLSHSELRKKFEDVPFVKSLALSCGFILEGEMSAKTWASILCQRIEAIKHDRQPAVNNFPRPVRAAAPDTVSQSEETESSISTGFDADDLVYEVSSPGSWIFVKNSSPQATIEDGSPAQVGGAETEEYGEPWFNQGQMSEFDTDPGHKEWEWDKDRQRWKRRGRSGLEETDWFPESFA